jgi:hypothetical protein
MPQSSDGVLLAGSFLVGLQITSAMIALWRRRRAAKAAAVPRRLPLPIARAALNWQILLGAFLFLTHRTGWSADSVGFQRAISPAVAWLAGSGLFALILLVYDRVLPRVGLSLELRKAAFHANRRMWPRNRSAKIMMGTALLMNPVTEELLMRGIFIYQLGLVLHSWVLPIAIGFILNTLLHAYQGLWVQATHAVFFTLVVTLLYSPLGLAGAIGAHSLADAIPILRLRHQVVRIRRASRLSSCRRSSRFP